jgi:hypothetical protein
MTPPIVQCLRDSAAALQRAEGIPWAGAWMLRLVFF